MDQQNGKSSEEPQALTVADIISFYEGDAPQPVDIGFLNDEELAERSRLLALQWSYDIWQKLDTGAQCGGETKKFTRGYALPGEYLFVKLIRMEEFEGKAWISHIREDLKYFEVTTRCENQQLAKFRFHVEMKRWIGT
jgi:hypothetical protein